MLSGTRPHFSTVRSLPPTDNERLLQECVTTAAQKNILLFSDFGVIEGRFRKQQELSGLLSKLVERFEKHTCDSPHPLRLVLIQGGTPELVFSFMQAAVRVDTRYLLPIWKLLAARELRFLPREVEVGAPVAVIGSYLDVLRRCEPYVSKLDLLDPGDVESARVILERSGDRERDFNLLCGRDSVLKGNSALRGQTGARRLEAYYDAGYKFIFDSRAITGEVVPKGRQLDSFRIAAALSRMTDCTYKDIEGSFIPAWRKLEPDLRQTAHELVKLAVDAKANYYSVQHAPFVLRKASKSHLEVVRFLLEASNGAERERVAPLVLSLDKLVKLPDGELAAVRNSITERKFEAASVFLAETVALDVSVRAVAELRKRFLEANKGLKGSRIERIIEGAFTEYEAILSVQDGLKNQSIAEIRREFKVLVAEEDHSSRNFRIQFFAYASVLFADGIGYRPYDSQMLAALLLSDLSNDSQVLSISLPSDESNDTGFAEVQTGEGKSAVCALVAAFLAIAGSGVAVDVLTSDTHLARRDSEIFAPFFERLGITSQCYRLCDMHRKAPPVSAQVIYTTIGDIGFSELDRMLEAKRYFTSRRFGYVILDEADNLLLDGARTTLITGRPTNVPRVIDASHHEQVFKMVTAGEKAIVLEQLCAIVEKFRDRHPSLKGEPEAVIAHLFTSAIRAMELVEGRDYVVAHGRAVSIDWENNGRLRPEVMLSFGLQEFLHLKHDLPLPEPSATEAEMSYAALLKKYEGGIRCLSGSWSLEELPEIKEAFGIGGFHVPRRVPTQRKDFGYQVEILTSRRDEAILREMEQLRQTEVARPILLLADSVDEANFIHKLTRDHGYPAQLITDAKALDAHERSISEEEVVARAGFAGAVTVATMVGGRGKDIVLDAEARAAGGLFVCMTFIPLSERVEIQGIGRAGRQEDPGSTKFVVSAEHSAFLSQLPPAARELLVHVSDANRGSGPPVNQTVVFLRRCLVHIEGRRRQLVRSRSAESYECLESWLKAREYARADVHDACDAVASKNSLRRTLVNDLDRRVGVLWSREYSRLLAALSDPCRQLPADLGAYRDKAVFKKIFNATFAGGENGKVHFGTLLDADGILERLYDELSEVVAPVEYELSERERETRRDLRISTQVTVQKEVRKIVLAITDRIERGAS